MRRPNLDNLDKLHILPESGRIPGEGEGFRPPMYNLVKPANRREMISEKIKISLSSCVQEQISRRRANIKVAIKNRKSWRVIIGGPKVIMVTLVPILSRFSILMTIQLLIFSWAEQILLPETDNTAQCTMSALRSWPSQPGLYPLLIVVNR